MVLLPHRHVGPGTRIPVCCPLIFRFILLGFFFLRLVLRGSLGPRHALALEPQRAVGADGESKVKHAEWSALLAARCEALPEQPVVWRA
jgi:hypothetical protein